MLMTTEELDELEAWALHGKSNKYLRDFNGAPMIDHSSPAALTENEAMRFIDGQVIHAPRPGDQDG